MMNNDKHDVSFWSHPPSLFSREAKAFPDIAVIAYVESFRPILRRNFISSEGILKPHFILVEMKGMNGTLGIKHTPPF